VYDKKNPIDQYKLNQYKKRFDGLTQPKNRDKRVMTKPHGERTGLINIFQTDNHFDDRQRDVYNEPGKRTNFSNVIPNSGRLQDWQNDESIYFDRAYNKYISSPAPPLNLGNYQPNIQGLRFAPHSYNQYGLFNEGNYRHSGMGDIQNYEGQYGFPQNLTENVSAVYKGSKMRRH
jgi:hypothetical protein